MEANGRKMKIAKSEVGSYTEMGRYPVRVKTEGSKKIRSENVSVFREKRHRTISRTSNPRGQVIPREEDISAWDIDLRDD